MKKYVIYYRVSTKKQGESGLGLEAQKRDVELFLDNYSSTPHEILGEFTDIESGTKKDREQYQEALKLAKKKRATLLVAKLDRLGRKVSELSRVMEEVDLIVACMPNADKFQLHIYAALAEQERDFISKRTKAALKEAKARGVKLGRPAKDPVHKAMVNTAAIRRSSSADNFAKTMSPLFIPMIEQGKTYQQIADMANSMNVKTQRGKEWSPMGVRNIVVRLNKNQLGQNLTSRS